MVDFSSEWGSGRGELFVCQNGSNIIGRDWFIQLEQYRFPFVKKIYVASEIHNLANDFKSLFSKGLGRVKEFKPKILIKSEANPIFFKSRPISFFKKELASKALAEWEAEGVIEKVKNSDWATPIVTPLKKDGSIRICADFSVSINKCILRDEYPQNRPDELLAKFSGGTLYSVLDMASAYLQIEVEENSKNLLTINTHLGLFRYLRLPFGLSSAPTIWQRTIDKIIGNRNFVACYLSDIIVTGTSVEDNLNRFRDLLRTLDNAGLKLNLEKCHFFQKRVEYCGMVLSKDGLSISEKKLKLLRKCNTLEIITS